MTFKKEIIFLALIVGASFFFRIYRLDFAEGPIFDERAYYLEASRNYLRSENDSNIEHPPLGKELIALGIKLFGDNPYGWRLPALAFSLLALFLTYALAKEMFGGSFVPLTSTLLVSLDNLFLIHSRLAVLEMFLVAFLLGTALFLYRYYKNGGLANFLLLSFFFGLAFSTKWTALLILPLIVLFLYGREKFKRRVLVKLFFFSAFVLLIYATTYSPYILRNSFWGFLVLQGTIFGFWANFNRHSQFNLVTYFLNHVFVWVFNPGWVYDVRVDENRRIGLINALYNPAIFWLSFFYLWKSISRIRKELDARIIFLTLPIVLNLLPWFFVKRIQYLYYFLFSIPFLYILTSFNLYSLYRRGGSEGRYKVAWFLLTAGLVFLFYFPGSTELPVPKFLVNPFSRDALTIQTIENGTERVLTIK